MMLAVHKDSNVKSVWLVLLLLVLAFGSVVVPHAKVALASGNVYYFSSTGSDSNPGTQASPMKSIAKANSLLSSGTTGNTIFFKRGEAWYEGTIDLTNKSGSSTDPITIDAYGTGANPIISSMKLLDDAGWTYDGANNRWKHPIFGFSDALRLFVNGVSKYKVNTINAIANETDVDQTFEWFIKTGWAYANSGSTTVGPKNVELILPTNIPPVKMINTNYATIKNLDIRGGVVDIDSPSSNITIDNCMIRESNQHGIRVWNSSTTNLSQHVSNITITNNLIDKVWTTEENNTTAALLGDGIFLLDAVEGGLVRGNKVINFGHGGIVLSSYKATNVYGVHNVIVEQNDVSAGKSGYMHAFDVDGFPGLTTNNIIRRNYFHEFTSTSHIGGKDNKFYSNIIVGVTLTTQSQKKQPYAIDIAPWMYNGIQMEARDLYVVNNTILDTDEFSLQVLDSNPTTAGTVTNNVIANNIFGHYGYNSLVNAEVALDVWANVVGTLDVKNNNFWDTSTKVARFKDPSTAPHYTITDLNTCPNTTPDTCDANSAVDPLFVDYANRDFRLTSSSPIKASGTNAYAAILGSGFVDFYGNAWNATNPSIGAIQYGATP